MKWGILATGTMTLEVEGKEPEIIRCPVDINGFEYEICLLYTLTLPTNREV